MDTNRSGQVLLVTLLVLSVAMTIVLSLLVRTRTDVTTSTEVEESARAFSAAEAGIEEALKSGQETQGVRTLTSGVANYNTNITTIGAAVGSYVLSQDTNPATTATVWLAEHDTNDALIETPTYVQPTIDICWKGTPTPAVGVVLLYKRQSGTYGTAFTAFDSDGSRRPSNLFDGSNITPNGCGLNGSLMKRVNLFALATPPLTANDVLLALRLTPYYGSARFGVNTPGGQALPSQARLIESVGTTNTGVARKIVVTREYKSPASIFDAAVISQTNFGR